jgi:histidine triad (HIT) family protein
MNDCLFCKIVEKKIPSNKVLENEDFLAFHDINPKAPVHILIIPKAHYKDFNEVPAEIMGKMTPFIQEVAKKVSVEKSGYRLISNVGKNGGQEVPHLHFHLLGGTRLKWEHLSDSDTQNKF